MPCHPFSLFFIEQRFFVFKKSACIFFYIKSKTFLFLPFLSKPLLKSAFRNFPYFDMEFINYDFLILKWYFSHYFRILMIHKYTKIYVFLFSPNYCKLKLKILKLYLTRRRKFFSQNIFLIVKKKLIIYIRI